MVIGVFVGLRWFEGVDLRSEQCRWHEGSGAVREALADRGRYAVEVHEHDPVGAQNVAVTAAQCRAGDHTGSAGR